MEKKFVTFIAVVLCATSVTACSSETASETGSDTASSEASVSTSSSTSSSETLTTASTEAAGSTESTTVSTESEEEPLSEIEQAYNEATSITVYDMDNYNPDPKVASFGYTYKGMYIIDLDDPEYGRESSGKKFLPGALYRSIATCVEEYDNGGGVDEYWLEDYDDMMDVVFGYTGELTDENVAPYMDKIRPYFSTDDSQATFLYAIKDFDEVEADYDVDGEEFSCVINDTSKLAEDIGISETALGYSLGVLAENDGEVTFSEDGKVCSLHSTSEVLAIKMTVSYVSLEEASELDTDELAEDMGNLNSEPSYLVYNDFIYGYGTNVNTGSSGLVKVRTDGSEQLVLRDKCKPVNIHVNGEYVYAKIFDQQYGDKYNDSDRFIPNLFRCRTSGSDGKTIVKHVDRYQIVDDKIYYTKTNAERDNSKHYLYCCDLDGSNSQTVLEENVWDFYIVGDYMLYQEDRDKDENGGERIAVCNLKTGQMTELTDRRSFSPVLYGGILLYIGTDEDRDSEDAYNSEKYTLYAKA